MRRTMKIRQWAQGIALALVLMPVGGAGADTLQNDSGDQFNETGVVAGENALSGSGSQSSIVGGSANTGSGSQEDSSTDASMWETMINANAGSGAQIDQSSNSNSGDRDSADVIISLGSQGAVTASDLGSTVSGNSVSVEAGVAESTLSMDGEGSGVSALYGVNAVAASAGAQASQNVSVNVGAEVMTY